MTKKLSLGLGILLLLLAVTAQAEEEKKPAAGYGGGFFLQSDDGAFNLKINGRLQPRFQYTDNNTSDPAATFMLRRALLVFTGTIKEKASVGMVLLHATNSNNFSTVNIDSVTFDYAFMPQFNVSVGMVGLPLDLLGDRSSGGMLTTEDSLVWTQSDGSTAITATRESFGGPSGLGVNLNGAFGKFFYTWSVVNANESNYALNPNTRFSTGMRLGFNILEAANLGWQTDYNQTEKPALTVGLGATYQGKRTDSGFASAFDAADMEDGVDDFAPATAPELNRMLQFATGAAFRWKGLSLQGEVYNRYTKFASFGDLPIELQDANLTDFGYYFLAGYYVMPKKLELALQAAQIFREGPDNNANQFGGGINYYFHGNNLKTQLCYFWTEDYDDVTGSKNLKTHKAVLQLQAGF